MKNFKNYSAIAAGLMIVLLLVPISEANSQGTDTIRLLATVCHNTAQTASHEASLAAEKQRSLLIGTYIGKAIGGAATDDNKERPQPGRLTSREIAREKALLQQFEANARRAAEVRESAKKLTAELERKQAKLDGIQYLVSVAQMKAQTASDEALHGAEDQRKLVKQQELLRSPSESGGLAAGDNKQRPQPGRLTARELAREKAVLQQLEANARRSAEVLESVKRLVAELKRQRPR